MPRYPWPASAVSPEHMRLLFQAREQGPTRTPICRLIACAIQRVYAPAQSAPSLQTSQETNPCDR